MSNDGIDLRVLCIVRNFSSNNGDIKKTEIILDGTLFEEVGDRFEYESSSFQLILQKRSDGVSINLDQHLNQTLENTGFSLSLESWNQVQIEDKNGKPPRKKECADASQSNANPSYGLRPSTSLPMLTNGPSNYPSYLNSPKTSRLSGLTQILTHFNVEESPMITIQCDGGDVVAKKSLLTAVSDVFKAMLESDMLEKRTNLILANDVNFETMKIIIDFYKEGTVSGFGTMKKDAFTYIVEKYNFLGIKEEIAEYLLQSYFMTQDIKLLDSVFFTYGDRFKKTAVIKEMALMIAEGKEAPKFVDNFNDPDFIELVRYSSDALKNSTFERYQGLLKTLYSWLSQDSEKRSVVTLEIIGIIDMQSFSTQNVQYLLNNLHLSEKFQGFKALLEKSLEYIHRIDSRLKYSCKYCLRRNCEERCLECEICKHDASHPYHVDAHCKGIHSNTKGEVLRRNPPLHGDLHFIFTEDKIFKKFS